MKEGIRTEERLLISLCRLEFDKVRLQEITGQLSGVLDWSYFLLMANAHGIIALVCHNLQKLDLLGSVPGEAAAILRNSLMKTLAGNEFKMTFTSGVLQLLNKENIRAVLLKGMALELTVYGNQGLRQMSDVDILVSSEQCLRAREILLENGYRSLPVKSVLHRLILKNVGKHLPSMEKNGVLVEIHHELFGSSSNGLTGMFIEGSDEILLKGEKVLIPDDQLLFLYLIRHLWLHERNNESQLRLYTDLAVLVERNSAGIFTPGFSELAARAGLEEAVASHLLILEKYWGAVFPESIRDFINQWYDPAFGEKFIFFLGSPKGNPSPDKSWYYRHFVNEIPGFRGKLVFILGDLFPTISFMKRRYRCSSGWKAILYYPHRLGKIYYLFNK